MSNPLTPAHSYIVNSVAQAPTHDQEATLKYFYELGTQLQAAAVLTDVIGPIFISAIIFGVLFGFYKSPILQCLCFFVAGGALFLVPFIWFFFGGIIIMVFSLARIVFHIREVSRTLHTSPSDAPEITN